MTALIWGKDVVPVMPWVIVMDRVQVTVPATDLVLGTVKVTASALTAVIVNRYIMPKHDKIKRQYEEAIAKGLPVQVQWKVNSWSDWIVASSPSWDKNIDYRLVLVTPYDPEEEDQMNTCEIPAVKESLTTQSKSEDWWIIELKDQTIPSHTKEK